MLEQLQARKTETRIQKICVYGVNFSEGEAGSEHCRYAGAGLV